MSANESPTGNPSPHGEERRIQKTIIALPTVELETSASADQMATNLAVFAERLTELAGRLRRKESGETFRLHLTISDSCKHTKTVIHFDCNNGNGGGGNGGG